VDYCDFIAKLRTLLFIGFT